MEKLHLHLYRKTSNTHPKEETARMQPRYVRSLTGSCGTSDDIAEIAVSTELPQLLKAQSIAGRDLDWVDVGVGCEDVPQELVDFDRS